MNTLSQQFPGALAGLQIVGGVLVAVLFLLYLNRFNVQRKIAFMSLALLLAAAVYVVFALVSRNQLLITMESIGFILFLLMVGLAFKYSSWFVVLGWLLHVVWDIGLIPGETAPHVPSWYAWFCVGFDLVVAAYLGVILAGKSNK